MEFPPAGEKRLPAPQTYGLPLNLHGCKPDFVPGGFGQEYFPATGMHKHLSPCRSEGNRNKQLPDFIVPSSFLTFNNYGRE